MAMLDLLYNNINITGVLALGGFIGFILGFALLAVLKNVTVKAAIAVVGCALGTAPLAFMTDLGPERWMYPIGLVLGLLIVRMYRARSDIARKMVDNGGDAKSSVYLLGLTSWS